MIKKLIAERKLETTAVNIPKSQLPKSLYIYTLLSVYSDFIGSVSSEVLTFESIVVLHIVCLVKC